MQQAVVGSAAISPSTDGVLTASDPLSQHNAQDQSVQHLLLCVRWYGCIVCQLLVSRKGDRHPCLVSVDL